MAADLTTYDKALKEDYSPTVVNQLYTKTVTLKRIRKGNEELEGREFVIPLATKMSEGVGSRGSTSSTLPTPGSAGYDNAILGPKYHWGEIQVSKVVIEHTKGTKGAWVKALDSETASLAKTMVRDANRQLWNDGTGLISRCGITTAANVVVLGTLVAGIGPDGFRALGNAQLRVGMNVDILTRSNGAVIATNRLITAINVSANTITINGAAVTTAATDGVYRAGNKSGATNYEAQGFRSIVSDTGALEGLDPATPGQEFWASTDLSNGGTNRTISELLMQSMVDAIDLAGDGETSLIVSSHGVRRSYFNLLVSLKRFVKPMTLEGGFDALDFNGKAFVVDKDARANSIYFIDESHLKIYELTKPSWMDDEGSVLKWDQGTGYVAVYNWFMNFGTDERNAHGLLGDITES